MDSQDKINDLLKITSVGIVTANDKVLIKQDRNILLDLVSQHYNITPNLDNIHKIAYRPFDEQLVYYDTNIIERPRTKIMRHMLLGNHALVIGRQGQVVGDMMWNLVFCTNSVTDFNLYYRGGGTLFPLYLYPEEGSFDTDRRPNLDATIWAQINAAIGNSTSPEDIFDYIYGVLHSPTYRTKYKEFLKVDFPRIPYPASAEEFEHFRSHGNRLRELHLMHDVPESPVTFPYPGTMQVDSLAWEYNKDDGYSGNIYINDTQCFEGVPTAAFEMYIGGYQPAQKWLKDRKGRTLTFDDIEHYRRIIAILIETDKIMKQIDNN